MSTKILTGLIIRLPEGNPEGGDYFYLELSDTEFERIEFSHYDQVKELDENEVFNTYIDITVEEEQFEGAYIVPIVTPFYTQVN